MSFTEIVIFVLLFIGGEAFCIPEANSAPLGIMTFSLSSSFTTSLLQTNYYYQYHDLLVLGNVLRIALWISL